MVRSWKLWSTRSGEEQFLLDSKDRRSSEFPEVPADNYAETLLIGCLLIDSRRCREVRDVVGPQDFFDDQHREVFEAIGQINHKELNNRCPVDIKLLHDYLISHGKSIRLSAYSQAVGTGWSWEYYAHRIKDMSVRRAIYLAGMEMMHSASDMCKPLEEVIGQSETAKDSIDIVERFVKCFAMTRPEQDKVIDSLLRLEIPYQFQEMARAIRGHR